MLITMMVIVGLLLLSAGIITFTSKATNSANSLRRREQLANCALAVRQYIASQLRFPNSPSINSLSFTIPGSGGKDIKLMGGHYDAVQVTGFQLKSSNAAGGVASSVEELGNNVYANPSGTSMTGTATCSDADQNQYEVEFSFAFGV